MKTSVSLTYRHYLHTNCSYINYTLSVTISKQLSLKLMFSYVVILNKQHFNLILCFISFLWYILYFSTYCWFIHQFILVIGVFINSHTIKTNNYTKLPSSKHYIISFWHNTNIPEHTGKDKSALRQDPWKIRVLTSRRGREQNILNDTSKYNRILRGNVIINLFVLNG